MNIIPKDCCRSRKLLHQDWVQAIAVSPTFGTMTNRIASVDRSGFIHVHNIQGNHGLEFVSSFNDGIHLTQITSVCWMGDDQIAFGGGNGLIRIRHINDSSYGMTTPSGTGHNGQVLSLTRSGTRSQLLISGGHDGRIKIFDPRSRRGLMREVLTISAGYHPVRSLAATCGNNHVTVVAADGGASGDVHVFDSRKPRGYHELDGNQSARWRGKTHAPKGNALAVLHGVGRVTRTVAMSEDGETVFTGGDDRIVRLWNLGQQVGGAHDNNILTNMNQQVQQPASFLELDEVIDRRSDYASSVSSEEDVVLGLNNPQAWNEEWGIKSINEKVESRLLLAGSVSSISCDISGKTFLCSDLTGGVYVSVSNRMKRPRREIGACRGLGIGDGTGSANSSVDGGGRRRRGRGIRNGGGLAHGEGSLIEPESAEHAWFEAIEEGEEEEWDDDEDDEDDDDRQEDEVDLYSGFQEIRTCSRVANITGRPLNCAITTNGYLGVTGSDSDDDNALRLFDLRLGYTPMQLKKDGFGARDMRESGFDVHQIIGAGVSARDALRGGYKPKDVARGGFGPEELKRAGCTLAELCQAGFDDATTLRDIGIPLIELKTAGFSPQELLVAGFTIQELVKVGVRGKVLRDLGCSLGDTLDGVWESFGKEAYFNELLHIALEWEYLTQKTMSIMRENISEGAFSMIYYADMWEQRLNVTNRRVIRTDPLTWKED